MTQTVAGRSYQIKLSMNGEIIQSTNIERISFKELIFNQTIEMECSFFDVGAFVELFPLTEDANIILEVSLTPNSEPLIIKMVLNDYEIERQSGIEIRYVIHFSALSDIKNFYKPLVTKAFPHKTTSSVISDIAMTSDIIMDKRVDSNDIQTWYQISTDNYNFIRHLLKRSYVGAEDTPFCYLDRNGKIVYTSLVTECSKAVKITAMESGMLSNSETDPVLGEYIKKIKEKSKTKIVYFKPGMYQKNTAGTMNKDGGYGTSFTYYDNKDFINYKINNKYVPLTQLGQVAKKNEKLFSENINYHTQGNGVHKNYFLGCIQNDYIPKTFFNNFIQITLTVDFEINLFDKINVIIPDSLNKMLDGAPLLDKVNSGEYIVGGIVHTIEKNGFYNMVLVLFRNGINDPENKKIKLEMIKGSK